MFVKTIRTFIKEVIAEPASESDHMTVGKLAYNAWVKAGRRGDGSEQVLALVRHHPGFDADCVFDYFDLEHDREMSKL